MKIILAKRKVVVNIKLHDFARPIIAMRKKYKYTQEQAAERLGCTTNTISRIENGEHAPSLIMVETALQLLGEDSHEYLPYFLKGEEKRGYLVMKQLDQLYTQGKPEQMRALIQEVEDKKPFTHGLFKQSLLLNKVVSDEVLSPQERYDQLVALIKMTKKSFDPDEISSYFLSYTEIRIIGELADSCHKLGDIEKAVQILYGLRECIDKQYLDETEKARTMPQLLYNLGVYLGSMERNAEMYAMCKEAKEYAIRNNRMRALPSVLATIAHYEFLRKNYSGCKATLLEAYFSARGMERYELADLITKVAKDRYQIDLDAVRIP